MRTPEVIAEKIKFLEGQRSNFWKAEQILANEAEIDRLKWVLEIGPDYIRVPLPGGKP